MNALIAAWSLRSFRHGFAVGAGAMSADFLLMLFTLTLYDVLKGSGQRFFAPFHAAGGLFFLYLAYNIGTAKPPQEGSAEGEHPVRGYLLGLLLGLVNPYQMEWWLMAGLSSIVHFGVEWAAGLFLAILTWITAFPAAVGWGGASTAA
jgi:threonine/homoserine/homoserine lactone efflux protein